MIADLDARSNGDYGRSPVTIVLPSFFGFDSLRPRPLSGPRCLGQHKDLAPAGDGSDLLLRVSNSFHHDILQCNLELLVIISSSYKMYSWRWSRSLVLGLHQHKFCFDSSIVIFLWKFLSYGHLVEVATYMYAYADCLKVFWTIDLHMDHKVHINNPSPYKSHFFNTRALEATATFL